MCVCVCVCVCVCEGFYDKYIFVYFMLQPPASIYFSLNCRKLFGFSEAISILISLCFILICSFILRL